MKVERPDWSEFWSLRLSNQKAILEYIELLEKRIVELGAEVEQLETKNNNQQEIKRLTELWCRGELEN